MYFLGTEIPTNNMQPSREIPPGRFLYIEENIMHEPHHLLKTYSPEQNFIERQRLNTENFIPLLRIFTVLAVAQAFNHNKFGHKMNLALKHSFLKV